MWLGQAGEETLRIDVPSGSIYFKMYEWGLRHIPWSDVQSALLSAGKEIRDKDIRNYTNGWQNAVIYDNMRSEGMPDVFATAAHTESRYDKFRRLKWCDYPDYPYLELPDEIIARWVPCNAENKPMIPWSKGCKTKVDALSFPGQVYLGENMKGCKTIVLDCDGDHDKELDLDTIKFMLGFKDVTHMLSKPKLIKEYEGYEDTGLEYPASFHLTFTVDKLIPTMHFPWANIDIVGNAGNSLRYWKNKKWNGLEPAPMTDEIWEFLKGYIKMRKDRERYASYTI